MISSEGMGGVGWGEPPWAYVTLGSNPLIHYILATHALTVRVWPQPTLTLRTRTREGSSACLAPRAISLQCAACEAWTRDVGTRHFAPPFLRGKVVEFPTESPELGDVSAGQRLAHEVLVRPTFRRCVCAGQRLAICGTPPSKGQAAAAATSEQADEGSEDASGRYPSPPPGGRAAGRPTPGRPGSGTTATPARNGEGREAVWTSRTLSVERASAAEANRGAPCHASPARPPPGLRAGTPPSRRRVAGQRRSGARGRPTGGSSPA